MDGCAVIGTHHKTGTVWMRSTFGAICEAINLQFRPVERNEDISPNEIMPPIVVFQSHSEFTGFPWLITNEQHRIFHLIRDPRDVIISATHYHRVAQESQLHRPRKKFGGKTYQEQLNDLPTDRDRYLFEMENTSANVIRAMHSWNYQRPNCFECKYEDLMADADMTLFSRVLSHLGFSNGEITIGQKKFWQHSIFGKKAGKTGTHIRSGAARQWPDVFDRRLAETFVQEFGGVLVALGYERDNSWVDRLPNRSRLEALAQRSAG